MLSCIVTLIVLSIAVLFTVSSQYPGAEIQATALMPLSMGYSRMFGIDYNRAAWFAVPATFVSSFGFMFAYGRQLSAMAKSGMVPQFMQLQSSYGTPYISFIFGSLVAILIIIPVYFSYRSFVEDLFFWCTLGSFFIYMCAFISFIELRRKYSSIERSFVNPLGIGSAIYGMAIFTLNFISIIGFQGTDKGIEHRIHPIAGFVSFMGFALIWYCAYTHKYQCFSDEEQKVMFSAYVIKANVKGRKKLKGKDKGGRMARQLSMAASSSNSSSTHTVSFFSFSLRSQHSAGRTPHHSVHGPGHSSAKSESSAQSSEDDVTSSRTLSKVQDNTKQHAFTVPEDEPLYSESNGSHSTNDAAVDVYSAARHQLGPIMSDSNFRIAEQDYPDYNNSSGYMNTESSTTKSARRASIDDEPLSTRKITAGFVGAIQGLLAGGSLRIASKPEGGTMSPTQAASPRNSARIAKASSRENSRRIVASKIVPLIEESPNLDLEHGERDTDHRYRDKSNANDVHDEPVMTATETFPEEPRVEIISTSQADMGSESV